MFHAVVGASHQQHKYSLFLPPDRQHMRGYLKIVTAIFLLAFIFSCNDEEDLEKDLDAKGYSLYCWPSKTACDNKEYGIEFSYRGVVFTLPGQPVVLPRLATLVCCSYIQSLIDTLTVYNDLLKTSRQQGTNLNRSCDIGPDITYMSSIAQEG